MERRQDELVKAMMEEGGSTIGISMFQMFFVPGLYRMAASAAYDVKGEIIPADHKNSFSWPSASLPGSSRHSVRSMFRIFFAADLLRYRSPMATRRF